MRHASTRHTRSGARLHRLHDCMYMLPVRHRLFEADDACQPFKHFCPNFPNSDTSLSVASSIFMAIVFR